ncbi:hypothetical protein PHMEG_00015734 [Phytophthora megakarya]|uniref:Uncharacterized protein n=1 Tax=Phytophthora megakarya TaxID=4795 RepID=A0A225W222_9STRA|nr:hypothetical protein PHMEG_00015734 [Phytophthora megakarya]
MSTKKPPHRKVTGAEHQRFVERLTGRRKADKLRLLKEHTEYIYEVRDRDADFGDPEPGRQACLNASYLKSNQRFISEQRRKVAAKTLAGSGKKRLSRKRAPYEHEDYVSDDNDYVSDEDDDFSPSGEDDDDETPKKAAIRKKTVVKSKRLLKVRTCPSLR